MNEITLPIEPTAVAKPVIRATVQHVLVQFQAAEWATIRVNLLDEDNRALQAYDVPMTLQESKAWKGDDTYILNLALSKLGLIVATEG